VIIKKKYGKVPV